MVVEPFECIKGEFLFKNLLTMKSKPGQPSTQELYLWQNEILLLREFWQEKLIP
jgi:hypothetical protein